MEKPSNNSKDYSKKKNPYRRITVHLSALTISILCHALLIGIFYISINSNDRNSKQPKPLPIMMVSLINGDFSHPDIIVNQNIDEKSFMKEVGKILEASKATRVHLKDTKESKTNFAVNQLGSTSSPLQQRTTQASMRYRVNSPPIYPKISRDRGHEGLVLLEVLVSTEGTALEIVIMNSSGHKALDKSAINAVKKWIFFPATNRGNPVEKKTRIPIRFKLQDR